MRYTAVEDSGHTCCFYASVRDSDDHLVCECFTMKEAEKIAAALNLQEVLSAS